MMHLDAFVEICLNMNLMEAEEAAEIRRARSLLDVISHSLNMTCFLSIMHRPIHQLSFSRSMFKIYGYVYREFEDDEGNGDEILQRHGRERSVCLYTQ